MSNTGLSLVEENSNLKKQLANLEKSLSQTGRKEPLSIQKSANANLLKDLRRLNEDNASLYDDNKLLMRENKQLKK